MEAVPQHEDVVAAADGYLEGSFGVLLAADVGQVHAARDAFGPIVGDHVRAVAAVRRNGTDLLFLPEMRQGGPI